MLQVVERGLLAIVKRWIGIRPKWLVLFVPQLFRLVGHTKDVTGMVLLPKGAYGACIRKGRGGAEHRRLLTSSLDGKLRMWDISADLMSLEVKRSEHGVLPFCATSARIPLSIGFTSHDCRHELKLCCRRFYGAIKINVVLCPLSMAPAVETRFCSYVLRRSTFGSDIATLRNMVSMCKLPLSALSLAAKAMSAVVLK